ncbi:MAG: FHA domain-containing protein [Muribaculaceae bacterium]|nr:FHA domain-containing protein [Muribaculaceae bacterium]
MSLSDIFYRGSTRKGGTCIVVPGTGRQMDPDSSEAGGYDGAPASPACETQSPTRNVEVALQDRPLVGVMMSASADGMGEIFPIYLGKNTIGRGEDCDVKLNEATVSPNHAVILVRSATDGYGQIMLTATLTDYSSDYGSNVDGVQADYEKLILHNGSTLRIGRGYVLTLYLFNPWIAGFGKNPVFMPAEDFPLPAGKGNHSGGKGDKEEILRNSEAEIGAGVVGEADEFSFYGRTVDPAGRVDHAHAETVSDRRNFYNEATGRNPDAAPGTVMK